MVSMAMRPTTFRGGGFRYSNRLSGARIELSATTVAENASVGALIGTLSVANGSGTYAFSISADPDSKFQLDGGDDTQFEVGAALDYETASSHAVTIAADNGVDDPISRAFTITVTNVLEVTLVDLSLDNTSFTEGDAAATVIGAISGAASGSTVTLLDDAGGKAALSGGNIVVGGTAASVGSFNITLRETHPDAGNSPHDTVIAITVASAARIAGNSIAYALGDSRTNQNVTASSHCIRGNGAAVAIGLSLGRMELPLANINGGSGETADTIYTTRFATALASAAKTLVLMAGVNQGADEDEDFDAVEAMATEWVASASDRIVFVSDEMPVDTGAGWDSTKKARHASLRDRIRALEDNGGGIYIWPTWQAATGGNDGDTPVAGFFNPSDGIHPQIPGAFGCATALVSLINSAMPAHDPYDEVTFANLTTLDGQNFAGVTDDAISVASLSASNVTASRMVEDGDTTWAEVTFSTTSSVLINRSSGAMPSNVIAGSSYVRSVLLVKVHAGATNIRNLQLRQIKQSGGNIGAVNTVYLVHPGTTTDILEIPTDEDVYILLITDPMLVAADATQARWQLSIQAEIIATVTQTMVGTVSVAFGGMIVVS